MATLYLRDSTGVFAPERLTNVPHDSLPENPFTARQVVAQWYAAAHKLDTDDALAAFESWTPDRVTGTTLICVAADGSGAILTAYLRP